MGDRLYSNKASDRAKDFLNHYIQLIMENAGLRYDSDTRSELDQLIDEIISASSQEIKELKTRIEKLESALLDTTAKAHAHESGDGSWEQYQHFKRTHGGE